MIKECLCWAKFEPIEQFDRGSTRIKRGGYGEGIKNYNEVTARKKQPQARTIFAPLYARVRDETGRRPAFNAGLYDLSNNSMRLCGVFTGCFVNF